MKTSNFFLLCLSVSAILLSGCVDKKADTELLRKMKFDWDLTEVKAVSSQGTYSVINQDGDTIATGLSGSNSLHIAKGDILTTTEDSEPRQTKASVTSKIYFPTDKEYASFWAEDNFPFKGDKDFNDIVLGARYIFNITDGYVSMLQIDVNCKASGSTFDLLGFAIQLDGFAPETVSSTGGFFKSDFSKLFSVNTNYIENGTTNAVIPIIGDFRNTFTGGRKTGLINTFNDQPHFYTRNQFSVKVTFSNNITYEQLYAALNPFVVVGERGKEIHLKGMSPTSKFDTKKYPSLFVDDEAFVWMMMIPKKLVKYPSEMVNIYDAYPQFDEWVFTELQSRDDWYMFPDTEKVYQTN